MRLNHVALTVQDRERARTFYGKYFGITAAVHDDNHLLILEAPGGGLLALREGDPSDAGTRNHFGFEVESPLMVIALREQFRDCGVPEIEFEQSGTFTRVQVLDPDGYRVEVYSM